MPNFCGYPDGPCSLTRGEHRHHEGDKRAFDPGVDMAYVVGAPCAGKQVVQVWVTGEESCIKRSATVRNVESFLQGLRIGLGETYRLQQARDERHAHELLGVPGWYRGP